MHTSVEIQGMDFVPVQASSIQSYVVDESLVILGARIYVLGIDSDI